MQNKRVLYTNESGGVSVIVPAPDATEEQCVAAVPEGVAYEIVDVDAVPADRTFRAAWFHDVSASPEKVGVDVGKAKNVCHARRRAARTVEFAPLDEVIAKQIPGRPLGDVEADRQAVRDKYATIQTTIDAAQSVDELKTLLDREAL